MKGSRYTVESSMRNSEPLRSGDGTEEAVGSDLEVRGVLDCFLSQSALRDDSGDGQL